MVTKATFIIPTMVITKIQSIINLRISSLLTLKISLQEAPSSSSALEKVPNFLNVETKNVEIQDSQLMGLECRGSSLENSVCLHSPHWTGDVEDEEQTCCRNNHKEEKE